jgi:hypothetical protein
VDQDGREHVAIFSEALYSAFFWIADCFGSPEQRYRNGFILFGCIAIGDRATVAVYRERSLDHDSPWEQSSAQQKYNLIGENQQGSYVTWSVPISGKSSNLGEDSLLWVRQNT